MSYEWDVFVSYRRSPFAEPWVHRLFVPTLRQWLPQYLGRASVFLDADNGVRPGDRWPQALGAALARSRVVLTVLEAEFFHSDWCVAEFQTAMARRQLTGFDAVLPIRLADGDFWADEARALQFVDFEPWNWMKRPSSAPRGYHDAVKRLCADIRDRVQAAPPWDAAWPVHTPVAPPPVPVEVPRWSR